jgi:hypothetical protein
MKRINQSPAAMAGRGMAVSGLIMGYLAIFFQFCWIGGFIWIFREMTP